MWLKWCYLTSVSRSESVLYLPPHSLGVHSQWETIYYVGNSATCEIHITDRLHGGSRLTAPAELQASNQHKVSVMRVSCFDCPAQSHLKITVDMTKMWLQLCERNSVIKIHQNAPQTCTSNAVVMKIPFAIEYFFLSLPVSKYTRLTLLHSQRQSYTKSKSLLNILLAFLDYLVILIHSI